jgi:hypothetical protein
VHYRLNGVQVKQEVEVLLEAKARLQEAESKSRGLQKESSGKPEYSQDFFGRSAFLAVSGQLNAEAYACALTDVYTFGTPPIHSGSFVAQSTAGPTPPTYSPGFCPFPTSFFAEGERSRSCW